MSKVIFQKIKKIIDLGYTSESLSLIKKILSTHDVSFNSFGSLSIVNDNNNINAEEEYYTSKNKNIKEKIEENKKTLDEIYRLMSPDITSDMFKIYNKQIKDIEKDNNDLLLEHEKYNNKIKEIQGKR